MAHVSTFRPMLALLVSLSVIGCAAQQPVLYPNGHLNSVGREVADQDIRECVALARSSGAGNGDGVNRTVARTAEGAVVGGATGAAVGAVRGNAGHGAAVGSVGAATARFTQGLFRTSEPDGLFKSFVNRCLRDRGYETIGWN